MSDSKDVPALVAVLGRVPSGIYILTVRREERESGLLASWVMQAGFEPPSITVAVRQDRYIADWLSAGVPFALNVVAEHQKSLLNHFARGFEPDAPAFDGLNIERTDEGVPVLCDGTVGYLLCQPGEYLDSGDHRVFVAKVIGGALGAEADPMLHVRKSGSHY